VNERIDHTNYEAWLLDRLEGALTVAQERELDVFLAAHPEYVPAGYELPKVRAVTTALTGMEKQALKRSLPPFGVLTPDTLDDHLIARSEGDLVPTQLEALRAYLLDHPELQRAERLVIASKLIPEPMPYPAKSELQRHFPPLGMPANSVLADLLVARLEGDLSPEQDRALAHLIGMDPEAQRAWALMQATRTAAPDVAYPHKQRLKKGGRVIAIGRPVWAVRMAAAASIAALVGLGLWYLINPAPSSTEIARVGPKAALPLQRLTDKPPVVVEQSLVPSVTADRPSTPATDQEPMRVQNPVPWIDPVGPPAKDDQELPLAEEPAIPRANAPEAPIGPEIDPVPQEPIAYAAQAPIASEPAKDDVITLGELLTSEVRDRVLDKPEKDGRPLNGGDLVALVDRGLKAVGGDRSGLVVDRKNGREAGGFSLRLGRNLSISARR